ncbi:MAG: 4Fe-4S binding protein [Planctomycetota bacterium]|nr:4Fe-4S binding protein [Planctomycetota bacterium]
MRFETWTPLALRLCRLGMLAAVVFIIRANHARLDIPGDWRVTLAVIKPYYPGAARLVPDAEKTQFTVLDARGNRLGCAVRTSPMADAIIGYIGPTDTLVALDPNLKVLGVAILRSPDTPKYVDDIVADPTFLKTWNGKTWDEVAHLDPAKAGIEGVSGATVTSMSIAESITYRLAHSKPTAAAPAFRMRPHDYGLIVAVMVSSLLAFTSLRGRTWLRRLWQAAIIGYVGLVAGDLLALSLFRGWTVSGVAWRVAPGLALLAAVALLAPWITRRPLYCQYLCPHGAAQELLDRISPHRLRSALPRALASGLRWLPALTLVVVLACTMLALPLDVAAVEPFDAWLVRSAGWASVVIAALSLVAALFVPMAYCRFGCPTGAVLDFVRSRGPRDRFGTRDAVAAALVALAALLYWQHETITRWITGPL